MKKLTISLLALALGVCAIGCSEPPEQTARNVIAAGSGALSKAQADYTQSCTANPAQQVCQIINRTIDGENAAITALETYCGFQLTPTLPDPSSKCVPVKSALPALQASITNLNQLVGELKGAARISRLERSPIKHEEIPLDDIPLQQATLTPGAISLALLGLKLLLQNVLKGEAGEYSAEAIDGIQNSIAELESVQGTEVTLGQLESLRLHKLWPDTPASGNQASATTTGGPSSSSPVGHGG